MMKSRRLHFAIALALSLSVAMPLVTEVVVGGSAGAATSTVSTIPAPPGLPAFYSQPKPLPRKFGQLIKFQVAPQQPLTNATSYQVMYTGVGHSGRSTAVTGLVVVPDGTAPAGGWPVIAWGHGTNGMADICAPSLQSDGEIPGLATLINDGYAVVASDYQGEGTRRLMPYIVGAAAAGDTIRIVSAAHSLPGVTLSNQYVVWGHSEGGQTAMFSLYGSSYYKNIADTNLQEMGVVAGAPPALFSELYNFLVSSPYDYYLLMVAGSYQSYYGKKMAPVTSIMSKAGRSLLPALDQGCSDYVQNAVNAAIAASPGSTFASFITTNPYSVPAWKTLLDENDPAQFSAPSSVPLLMIQGGDDAQIPPALGQYLQGHECSIGQESQRWQYSGQSHAGVITPSLGDMMTWIGDRFAGGTLPDPYVPTAGGDSSIVVTQAHC
jgi:fermentation-respiration switch protein FrsA (DUF1100 family)